MGKRPQRCWTVEVVAGGDTWVDAVDMLRELIAHVDERQTAGDVVIGGADRGGLTCDATARP